MAAAAIYNEIDPFAAAWLRNLITAGEIADGVVNERSIAELSGDAVVEATRVHLFAGIGGWDLALQLAGWPDDEPVWTGSCPFPGDGQLQRGRRHVQLAPDEAAGGVADGAEPGRRPLGRQPGAVDGPEGRARGSSAWGRLGDPERHGTVSRGRAGQPSASGDEPQLHEPGPAGAWDDSVWLPCADGQARRAQSGVHPLAHGIPGRLGRLRAYGNAIVPQVAAVFVRAFMESSSVG